MARRESDLEIAVVGEEITWHSGWDWNTGVVTRVWQFGGKNIFLAVQCGRNCELINSVGFGQQTLFGGTVDDMMKIDDAYSKFAASAARNASAKY